VQVRYRQQAQPAEVEIAGDRVMITFVDPQRAITPGQAAVFYRDRELVGGGWIL
jgi:tRNA-specific 2-thiouridylase